MKVVLAERGEYEQRYIDYVGYSAESILYHIKKEYPDKNWEIVDVMITPKTKDGFTPYRDWYIQPTNVKYPHDFRYELLEEEVV